VGDAQTYSVSPGCAAVWAALNEVKIGIGIGSIAHSVYCSIAESRYTVNKIKNKLFMISSLIAIVCVNTLLHHKSHHPLFVSSC
jgi:hypothetical protein